MISYVLFIFLFGIAAKILVGLDAIMYEISHNTTHWTVQQYEFDMDLNAKMVNYNNDILKMHTSLICTLKIPDMKT